MLTLQLLCFLNYIQVGNEIQSWKGYKKYVKKVDCTKMAKERMRNVLWKGTTTPLVKPNMPSSTRKYNREYFIENTHS